MSNGASGPSGAILPIGFVFFTIGVIVLISYLVDRHAHEGVGYFRRRSVLRMGAPATAKVLSSTMLMTGTGSKYKAAYSLVYEVQPSSGGAPFRARAIETMFFSEADANKVSTPGATVSVRFDPRDNLVVLVRIDLKTTRAEEDERRRRREEALLKK